MFYQAEDFQHSVGLFQGPSFDFHTHGFFGKIDFQKYTDAKHCCKHTKGKTQIKLENAKDVPLKEVYFCFSQK